MRGRATGSARSDLAAERPFAPNSFGGCFPAGLQAFDIDSELLYCITLQNGYPRQYDNPSVTAHPAGRFGQDEQDEQDSCSVVRKTTATRVRISCQSCESCLNSRQAEQLHPSYIYSGTRANFTKLCSSVTANREIIIIQRRGVEDVALISAAELSSLMETAFLPRSPKNAERLLAALNRAQRCDIQ